MAFCSYFQGAVFNRRKWYESMKDNKRTRKKIKRKRRNVFNAIYKKRLNGVGAKPKGMVEEEIEQC